MYLKAKREYRDVLIVEGPDDKHAIIGLMKAHVAWPDQPPWPLWVESADGIDNLLNETYLRAELRTQQRKVTGLVVDADDAPGSRYQRIRQICLGEFPGLPDALPVGGVITEGRRDSRLGVWIMPDNQRSGGLELFLQDLVDPKQSSLWDFARRSASSSRQHGATYSGRDACKADLHTWLAWQDPPGRSFGIALKQRVLDPSAPSATAFIGWFKDLFQL